MPLGTLTGLSLPADTLNGGQGTGPSSAPDKLFTCISSRPHDLRSIAIGPAKLVRILLRAPIDQYKPIAEHMAATRA